MNEFQLALRNISARQGMSLSELAKRTGYDPLLFENIVTGKSRQIPVASSYASPMSSRHDKEGCVSTFVGFWSRALELASKPRESSERAGGEENGVRLRDTCESFELFPPEKAFSWNR